MGAIFAYARCSVQEGHTENQKIEIENAGYKIDYYFSESGVSGSVSAFERKQFSLMCEKIRDFETVVVSRIDRLGRNAKDICEVIEYFTSRNIKLIVLQFGSLDFTSATGKLIYQVFGSIAELERGLILERQKSGIERARREGIKFGRKSKTTQKQKDDIRKMLNEGVSVSSLARQYNISRGSIINIRSS
jgi:putative DNA-invertase from lambdoid prophage Rac